jgi:type I restriction enzyme R subunit
MPISWFRKDPSHGAAETVIYQPCESDPVVPPDDPVEVNPQETQPLIPPMPMDGTGRVKYLVSGVPVTILAERIQYYGPDRNVESAI